MSRKKRFCLYAYICAFALLIALFSARITQENAVAATEPIGQGSGYSSVLYDNRNGLPTSDVNAIVQTQEGFLWIGSYSGLIRYDGNEFYRYDSSYGVSSVVSLYVDSKNRLWIGSNDSGVFLMEGRSFRAYDREQGLRSSSVRAIIEDADGNILVATTMGMAYIDPNGEMRVIDSPQINQESIRTLTKDADGVVYGVTVSGAFFTMKNLRLLNFYGEAMGLGSIKSIFPDPVNKGRVYLGTDGSTVLYGDLENLKSCETISVAPQKNINSIESFGDVLWVCADNGIGFYEAEKGTYRSLSDTLPMNNSVEHVISDFEQNLWFTSSRQGLLKIVRNRFTEVLALAPRVVNTTYVLNDLLYVGTDTGLVMLNSDYDVVENDFTARMDNVRIRSIHEDKNGNLWFGTKEIGLVCYDPATGARTEYNDKGILRYDPSKENEEERTTTDYGEGKGLSSAKARTMFEMSDGSIAVATAKGVDVIKNGVVAARYGQANGVSNPEILCLEEGADGELYVGSDGDGIYVVEDGKVSHLGRDDGLRSEVIMRMRRDPSDPDLYWIITSNSIAYMKDKKITSLVNFPYGNNFDMYFDVHGRIWVLSSNGIYVVKRSVMLADKKIDYVFFDTSNGLPAAATANSYSYLGSDGTLIIAASTVSAVNINDLSDNNDSIRLSVPYVTADDEYLNITDGKVVVPSSCKRLAIYAYAFSYTLNDPHLSYRLEGFDNDDIRLTRHEMRPVVYTNLPGGEYTFTFSVVNTMTDAAEQTVTLTIVKEKTVYEHVWFWVLLALAALLLLAGILFFFFRRKTKALMKKEAHDKQLINEMTSVFAHCIDMKDAYTNGHSHRVAKYTAMIAERLGKSKEEVERYYRIALLHDIGKIGIPDNILNKPGRLTDEEYKVMKSHSERGYEILKEISIAPELAIGAGYHHERQDGHGYPHAVPQAEIPEVAQIIAVADTFDAMFSTRPYRRRMKLADIAAEIRRCKGTQLNEKMADILLQLIDEGVFKDENPENESQEEKK